LFGGWIGALLAQSIMHHKYHDIGFKFLFWSTLVLNIGLFGWTLTSEGAFLLQQAISELRSL
jgi:uncharacterized membrane protein YsdA (DUF1294 family)